MCSRFARLFWLALDRVDHAVVVSRCWLVDLIYGPDPPTPADEKRDADREQLQKAFTGTDFDGMVPIADEERHPQTQATLTAPLTASGSSPAPIRGVGSSSRTLNTPSALIEPTAKSFEGNADPDADREPPLSLYHNQLRARLP
jgi:hypothetical protein